ncbi:uncharacterized protein BDZ99DRAFT_458865 [Mytilinidion resinicola]|uniref:Alpha N-terminal protein methyltransferase 1 n=1 Tax=Mytilinidion resinicola TaxID=574789 RepID=A0A6A6Z266_9PEZI|nr:uncharacterized protein BDZ99DRAFT_458865 [Mytilinidion resinicola]KAF2814898.1 hypothetical protein BDZ99DRAFT_458865 [Mytilinidion resinicola]
MAPNDARPDEPANPPPPDASIDHNAALEYWNSIPNTVDGMLGGYPHITKIDLQGSANFLSKLRRQHQYHTSPQSPALPAAAIPLVPRVVDCGAGIGRITKGFLVNVGAKVDVVEPVKKFTDELLATPIPASGDLSAKVGAVGEVFNLGLQDWTPAAGAYNLIWNQWCVGHLTDAQLVAYLRRCKESLAVAPPESGEGREEQAAFQGAWIVVKENMSTHPKGEDDYDELDNSVTRTDAKFRSLFKEAGLKLVATEVQKGFPKVLCPVRIYALQAE